MIRRRENGNVIIQRERSQMGGINSDNYGATAMGPSGKEKEVWSASGDLRPKQSGNKPV